MRRKLLRLVLRQTPPVGERREDPVHQVGVGEVGLWGRRGSSSFLGLWFCRLYQGKGGAGVVQEEYDDAVPLERRFFRRP